MPDVHHCDHLILLVGSNPLPNAVAAKLLANPGGRVSLVHFRSPGDEQNSPEFRLKFWLEKQGLSVDLCEILDESCPSEIADAIGSILDGSAFRSVGLNYTGGSKAMSVHAHRTVCDWAQRHGKNRNVYLSYLDARKLKLRFDPEFGAEAIFVGDQKIGLEDMVELHGQRINTLHEEVRLPQSAQKLAAIFAQPDTLRPLWETWVLVTLYPAAKKWIADKNRSIRRGAGADISREALFPGKWENKTTLRSLDLPWPADPELRDFVSTIQEETQTPEAFLNLGRTARNGAFDEPREFCQWLDGEWLEHLVFFAFDSCRAELGLHDIAMDLNLADESGAAEFQFDVVAVRGYQLFACSCTTGNQRAFCKQKLIEAYVRAHQLGGDEVRVALVCCDDDPKSLEKEIKRDIDPEDRVRVFGFADLPYLPGLFRNWIKRQCRIGRAFHEQRDRLSRSYNAYILRELFAGQRCISRLRIKQIPVLDSLSANPGITSRVSKSV